MKVGGEDKKKFVEYKRDAQVSFSLLSLRFDSTRLSFRSTLRLTRFRSFSSSLQVLAITAHWPGGFDPSYALSLGFGQDDPETGFLTASQTFKEELEASK